MTDLEDDTQDDSDQTPLQYDWFVLKGRQSSPSTWKDVWARVNDSLKRVVSGAFELVGDVIYGARRIVHHVTDNIPGALASRVAGGHSRSDRIEARQQDLLEKGTAPSDINEAADALETILLALRAKGLHVEMRKLEGGELVLTVVRPEMAIPAIDLANKSIPETIKKLS